jgi:cytochrome oxidase Cu insertion factor (SCO1/SenC/PrrC family)
MSLRTSIITAMIFLLILGVVGPAVAEYHVGDHVADFTLPNAYGNNVSLYDYQDCIVVLAFWFAT